MDHSASITAHGEPNGQAPAELNLFAFLVGKWKGICKAHTAEGPPAEFELTWIGRYILNGMAIADEFHSRAPDGSPYLGISLRYFDTQLGSWIIEYLNVSSSFLRRQVNPYSGTVNVEGDAVVVISEDGQTRIRERYRALDRDHFTYTLDMSGDAGSSWAPVSLEMMMTRIE